MTDPIGNRYAAFAQVKNANCDHAAAIEETDIVKIKTGSTVMYLDSVYGSRIDGVLDMLRIASVTKEPVQPEADIDWDNAIVLSKTSEDVLELQFDSACTWMCVISSGQKTVYGIEDPAFFSEFFDAVGRESNTNCGSNIDGISVQVDYADTF